MLPNLNIEPIDLFGLQLHAFGFLVGLAIILGTILAGRRARAFGLSERVVADVAIWAVVTGFIGAHLYSAIFYFPEKIVADPLYLLKVWDGISSFGGFLGGAAGVILYFRRHRDLPFLPYADVIMYGFVFAWIFGRMGCTIAFDHPGVETEFFLGMQYQGMEGVTKGVRHNLGFYELLWALTMSAFYFLNRKRTHFKGWYLTVVVIAYMPVRFAFDFLREIDKHYLGLTAGQWAAIALFIAGVTMYLRGAKKGDLLAPDGVAKFRPKGELEAIARAETAGRPHVVASKRKR